MRISFLAFLHSLEDYGFPTRNLKSVVAYFDAAALSHRQTGYGDDFEYHFIDEYETGADPDVDPKLIRKFREQIHALRAVDSHRHSRGSGGGRCSSGETGPGGPRRRR